ncbi:MAG: ATP-binding protein [Bacteroidota bacterium]|jgi:signal transduction histidine kinase
MRKRHIPRFFLLFLDLVVLALCIVGVEQSRLKAGMETSVETHSSADGEFIFVIASTVVGSPLQSGDTLVSIENYPIRYPEDPEQILDQYKAGTVRAVTVRRAGTLRTEHVTLTPFYSLFDMIIQVAAIAVFFVTGLFVVSQRPRDPASLQFHHLVIMLACVMAFTRGYFAMEPYGIGHILRALFPLCCAFICSLLIHFTLVFPRSRPLSRNAALLLHLPAAAVAVWGLITSFHATSPFDYTAAPAFYDAMTTAEAMLGMGTIASVGIFGVKFSMEMDSGYRRQIAWAMTGTLIGTLAFLFWQLTTWGKLQMYLPGGMRDIIRVLNMDEIILNGALLLTAGFMAIGIIRYRMFNVEVLLKRGTVYTIVFAILILVYAAFLTFAVRFVEKPGESAYFMISIAALGLDLLLFMPTRGLVQRGIDRFFFRVDYDFRESLRSISERVLASAQSEDVAEVMVSGINDLMHPDGLMVMIVHGGNRLTVLSRRGFPRWRYTGLHIRPERLRQLPANPLVYRNVVEPGTRVVRSEMGFARRYGVAMLFPIRAENGTVVGLLILGEKKSGLRFTLEDIDLVRAVTVQAGLQFERLLLQQRLLLQRHETDKLRELSRMKSFFVSGVSHDLKTPLTSIKMFAELLENQLPPDNPEAQRSLDIIQGECGRLARLINNVLDFTRMERGMLRYTMSANDLNRLAEHAFETMEYQMRIGGFKCHLELHDGPLPVRVDADAILEAVNNLLGNAMKYSNDRRDISLRTAVEDGLCSIAVEDHGIGIRSEEIPHLFETFFRSQSATVQKLGGVGLGLSLVKHITDAHNAKITVESTPGEGSTFRLKFELLEE